MDKFDVIAITPRPSKHAMLFFENCVAMTIYPSEGKREFGGHSVIDNEIPWEFGGKFMDLWLKLLVDDYYKGLGIPLIDFDTENFKSDSYLHDERLKIGDLVQAARERGEDEAVVKKIHKQWYLEERACKALIACMYLQNAGYSAIPVLEEKVKLEHWRFARDEISKRLKERKNFEWGTAVEFSLQNVPVPDVESLSWEQVFEIREDLESKRSLRKLRVFLHESFDGKPASYIEDKLGTSIHEMQRSLDKHGVSFRLEVISSLLNSKSLLGTAALTISATLMGQPVVGGALALGGAAVETAKIGVSAYKSNREYLFLTGSHELEYIHRIQSSAPS